ncbi:MAG: DNA mismatch repair protein MutS, partial [Hymenobacteraceae bacterium]|nr:DNA mismatch repair protein MutS [Hymenobacteraceae bacterium]MDX5395258.1 DNA mismatch repair protein MutS [Hymenobacteraceae bacterium]MDX5511296.1 DNA mismatch repair protein MutS [Hymenobacteraceae bacterium]
MATKPTDTFTQRKQQFTEEEKKFAAISSRWSWVRVALFVAGIAGVWHFLSNGEVLEAVGVLAVGYVLFILILIKHSRADYQARHFGFLQQINQQEIQRSEGSLHKFDGGEKYLSTQHPYTADLDVFGKHSLFALLNRNVTDVGQNTLANWLQQPATAQEAVARQEAVKELTPQLDWRQHLQAKAMHQKKKDTNQEQFWAWLRQPDFFAGKLWLKVLTFLLPALTIAAIFAAIYEIIPSYYILFFVLLQYGVGYKFAAIREEYYEKSSGMGSLLKVYQAQLAHVETQEFSSEKLQFLRSQMFYNGNPLSKQVQKLAQLVEYFSVRMSTLMSFFLNNLLMWDFYWMWRLERWKKQSVPNLEPAIAAL